MSTPNQLSIEFVQGSKAPRYPGGTELSCEGVVVTEMGTEGDTVREVYPGGLF